MTVNIDIDLNARSAFVKLGGLKAQIETLGDDLDLDLDLDGDLGDTLDNLSDTMEDISESFNADLNESIDRLEDIEFDFGKPSVEGGGDSGGGTGSDSGDKSALQWAQQYAKGIGDDETDARSFDTIAKSFKLREDRLESPRYSDDSNSSMSMKEAVRRATSFSGFGSSESMTSTINDRHRFTKEDGIRMQEKINSLFADDFDFSVDHELTNKMGDKKIHGQTDMGTMSLDNYRSTRNADGVDVPFPDRDGKSGSKFSIKKGLRGIYAGMDKVTDSLKKAIPRMSTWFNILAAAVPALAAVAVQALGVASAFGAIALAGAGMVGLGLLGHGDSMAESFRNAGEEIDQLKQDLFDTFEPTADLFGGVQTEFFDFIPGELDRVSESMKNLLPLKEEFFEMFTQVTKFVEDFFQAIGDNESTISGLWDNFKGILGTEIVSFFEWLMMTAEKNQPMLVELGSVFKIVALALYEVFLVVSKAITKLSFLWVTLAVLAKTLNNEFVANLLTAVAVMYIFTNILPAMYYGLRAIGFALQTNMIPALAKAATGLSAMMTNALVAMGANFGLASSIAAVTTALLGLLAVSAVGLALPAIGGALMGSVGADISGAGGSAPTDFSGGGSSNGTTNNYYEGDTVNVDLSGGDTASYEKFADMQSDRSRGSVDGSYTG